MISKIMAKILKWYKKNARTKIPLWLHTLISQVWWRLPMSVLSLIKPQYKGRAVYAQSLEKPIVPDSILYESFHGKNASDNPLAMFRYLIDNPKYAGYTHIWVLDDVQPKDTALAPYLHRKNLRVVQKKSMDFFRALATAQYLFNNSTFLSYFMKRPEQTYVNLWHGTPLKNMGKHILSDKPWLRANVQRNFLHTDYFVHPNAFTAEKMTDSYDLDGVFAGKMAVLGYPRVDTLLHADRAAIRQKMGVKDDERLILYAPTWRGEKVDTDTKLDKTTTYVRALQKQLPKNDRLFFTPHDFQLAQLPGDLQRFVPPKTLETNELLAAADVLISDYSSVFFDFLCTGRPILFFTYDMQEYLRQRGTYIAMKDLPGPLCPDLDTLLTHLADLPATQAQYAETYARFVRDFAPHDDGHAAERVAQCVFAGKELSGVYALEKTKPTLLIFPGGMLDNGITAAVVGLSNNLDFDRYNIYYLMDTRGGLHNCRKINPAVKLLFVSRPLLYANREERYHLYDFALSRVPSEKNQILSSTFLHREARRIFGNSSFDAIINYDGYTRYDAALLAHVDAPIKTIWLHSDMVGEYEMKSYHYLRSIFTLYDSYDKLVCVSEDSHKQNSESLQKLNPNIPAKLGFVLNTIHGDAVLQNVRNAIHYQVAHTTIYTEPISELNPQFARYPFNKKAIPIPPDTIRFISIGRYSVEKDQTSLLYAFAEVVEKYPNALLYLVGHGPLENDLKHLRIALGLQNNVIITGKLKNPHYLLAQCDCFVLCSLHEAMPITTMESFILGKPIISTDIPGPHNQITQYGGGVLLKVNDIEHLRDAMIDFIEHGIAPGTFDYKEHNREAMRQFYEVLGI
ncbi:MAG: CDP-glycerol glycerophosphotransferase family protein [Oscillospiraceae bacterium]|jgi:CDP-glycerol glycerophosphotransferase|nr:CDP-glycerol glycerophosphotransferase family protein [Oscillospiraceae bacterium]